VIIRWHLQHGVVVIPKSRERERIAANADVDGFALAAPDMTELDSLGTRSAERRVLRPGGAAP
jgi:diketogulonate reductase-like aldo/keto reductase